MFDYVPGQQVQAYVLGGWKNVTVVVACEVSARVLYERGANQRVVAIYDPRHIRPCHQRKQNSPSTCPDQQSFNLELENE